MIVSRPCFIFGHTVAPRKEYGTEPRLSAAHLPNSMRETRVRKTAATRRWNGFYAQPLPIIDRTPAANGFYKKRPLRKKRYLFEAAADTYPTHCLCPRPINPPTVYLRTHTVAGADYSSAQLLHKTISAYSFGSTPKFRYTACDYFAYDTARVSRITVIFTCPGYVISS